MAAAPILMAAKTAFDFVGSIYQGEAQGRAVPHW